jgi:amino acid permease
MYIYILLIPTIPISWIKTYTYLSYVSMAGIFGALLGGILMISYCGGKLHDGSYSHEEIKYFDVGQTFGFIGIAMFAFEGNGVVINLRSEAKDKKKYPRYLQLAVLTVICWYMILSIICYFTYR